MNVLPQFFVIQQTQQLTMWANIVAPLQIYYLAPKVTLRRD